MSTHARICTVVFGSMPFTAAWEVAAYAGAHAAGDAQPGAFVIAAGGFPQVVAVAVVLAMLAKPAVAEPTRDPVPAQRRAVPAPQRKELAR